MEIMRESIFVSAVRSFSKAVAVILGLIVGGVLILIIASFFSSSTMIPETSQMTIMPDAEGKREVLAESSPVILHLDFNGVIGEIGLTHNKISNLLRDSRDGTLKNNRVKGVLLYMNTPGGTSSDSDSIYRAIMEYKKLYNVPVYAYVDSICASGGMYISCAADKIYSSPSAIIGSIGVLLGPAFNFSQVMQKVGIQSETITQGKDKDMLNPFRPWKEGEDQSLRNITAYFYKQFVDIVTTSRPRIEKDKLINEYGAQVYAPEEAETIGYIDVANSGYVQTLKDLVKAAGIAEKQSYQVVKLEPTSSLWSQLSQGSMSLLKGKITHTFQVGPHLSSEMSGKVLYLYQP